MHAYAGEETYDVRDQEGVIYQVSVEAEIDEVSYHSDILAESKSHYEKKVSYQFQVGSPDSDPYAITEFDDDSCTVEEVRKNGQEDTHIRGTFIKGQGVWELDLNEGNMFDTYVYSGHAQEIADYLNEHGLPGQFEWVNYPY
mgnify:CR=1 FL=1